LSAEERRFDTVRCFGAKVKQEPVDLPKFRNGQRVSLLGRSAIVRDTSWDPELGKYLYDLELTVSEDEISTF
jgi:hypothetical protein